MPSIAQSQTAFEAIAQNREISSRAEELAQASSAQEGVEISKVVDKYFVLKSLTVEDMELSVRNSIWATQAHNEDALNKAFEVSSSVANWLRVLTQADCGECVPHFLRQQVGRIFRICSNGIGDQ